MVRLSYEYHRVGFDQNILVFTIEDFVMMSIFDLIKLVGIFEMGYGYNTCYCVVSRLQFEIACLYTPLFHLKLQWSIFYVEAFFYFQVY